MARDPTTTSVVGPIGKASKPLHTQPPDPFEKKAGGCHRRPESSRNATTRGVARGRKLADRHCRLNKRGMIEWETGPHMQPLTSMGRC